MSDDHQRHTATAVTGQPLGGTLPGPPGSVTPHLPPNRTPPSLPMQQVLDRLDRSRARLQLSLAPAAGPDETTGGASWQLLGRARAWLRTTPWGGLLEPVIGAVSQEVLRWWQRQPWQQAVAQAKDALQAELSPLVRRHPLSAVLLTAAAGAVVASSGVWRWRTVRRSALQLGLRLRQACIGQLASPAVQSVLLGALVSFLATRRPSASPATRQTTEPQAPSAERGSNAGNARPSTS